jgi:hypothetical protein
MNSTHPTRNDPAPNSLPLHTLILAAMGSW